MIKERNDKIAKQINENLNSNTDIEKTSKLTEELHLEVGETFKAMRFPGNSQ